MEMDTTAYILFFYIHFVLIISKFLLQLQVTFEDLQWSLLRQFAHSF